MKRSIIFWIAIPIILVTCGTPAGNIPATSEPAKTQSADATQTVATAPTHTQIPSTPTVDLAHAPMLTPSAPAVCPQVDSKQRPLLGPVFKDKKAAYHDARQTVLDFLNQGGDPQTMIAKLAENDVSANQVDMTNDGVPEFILPSGYLTIFGCENGKYKTLLDIPPLKGRYGDYDTIPLTTQDLNHNGVREIFLAQVNDGGAKYSILEWNGQVFSPIVQNNFKSQAGNIYISQSSIYTIGQSKAQKGTINGNWDILDSDNNGLEDIIIKAGVENNFTSTSKLEEQVILLWNGESYVIGSASAESTPTLRATSTLNFSVSTLTLTPTPLPFSVTCSNKVSSLKYNLPTSRKGYKQSIADFLNAGGDPEQLKSFFSTTIKDLTNDGLLDVLTLSEGNLIQEPSIYIFTCVNGKYQEKLGIDSPTDRFQVGTFELSIVAIQDNNKNGPPEIVIKDIGCIAFRCGAVYIAEWDGTKFAGLIKDRDIGDPVDYAPMGFPKDVYLKDTDDDGIAELVWTGGAPYPDADQSGLPWRLETHVYKWDSYNYTAQPVEYSPPEYRFQAVQDGDRFALAGQVEKALKSYQLAITSESLGWWTEARQDYLLAQHGLGNCIQKGVHCPSPTPDPNERPILSAYTSYRMMLTQLLIGKPDDATVTYQSLLSTYPTGSLANPVVEMATAFWNEYQASKYIGAACPKAVAYAAAHTSVLAYLGSSYHGWQSIIYKPEDICPFK